MGQGGNTDGSMWHRQKVETGDRGFRHCQEGQTSRGVSGRGQMAGEAGTGGVACGGGIRQQVAGVR